MLLQHQQGVRFHIFVGKKNSRFKEIIAGKSYSLGIH